jgi:hypothetical protein
MKTLIFQNRKLEFTKSLLRIQLSSSTHIANLTGVVQFPTLKSQTEPLQIGIKSRTVCAAPPPALLTMALLSTVPCKPLPLCQRKLIRGSRFEAEPPVGLGRVSHVATFALTSGTNFLPCSVHNLSTTIRD